jgi:hypothetical protein
MKRAPVDDVDAKLRKAIEVRDDICESLTALPPDAVALGAVLMHECIRFTNRIALLKFAREEIIRNTFYR